MQNASNSAVCSAFGGGAMVFWSKQLKSSSPRLQEQAVRTRGQDVVEMPEEIAGKTFRQTGFHLTSKIFAAISLNIFFPFGRQWK